MDNIDKFIFSWGCGYAAASMLNKALEYQETGDSFWVVAFSLFSAIGWAFYTFRAWSIK